MKYLAYIISGLLPVASTAHVMGDRPLVGVTIFLVPAVFGIFYGMGLRRSRKALIFMVGYIIFFGMYLLSGIRYIQDTGFALEATGYIILSFWMGILYFSHRRFLRH